MERRSARPFAAKSPRRLPDSHRPAGSRDWLPSWWGVYGWFFGVAIAGAVYYALRTMALGAGAKMAKA